MNDDRHRRGVEGDHDEKYKVMCFYVTSLGLLQSIHPLRLAAMTTAVFSCKLEESHKKAWNSETICSKQVHSAEQVECSTQ